MKNRTKQFMKKAIQGRKINRPSQWILIKDANQSAAENNYKYL